MKAFDKRRLNYLSAARGLSKKQLLIIGNQLGLRLKDVPNYVARAVSTDPKTRSKINSQSTRNTNLFRYTVGFLLKYPLSFFKDVGLATALNWSVRGRVGFFRENLKKGVFKDQAAIAAKYGAVVTRIP